MKRSFLLLSFVGIVTLALPLQADASNSFTFSLNYCVFGASCTTPNSIHQSGIGAGNVFFGWTGDSVTITDTSTPQEFFDIWNVTDENNVAIAGYAEANQPQDFSLLPNGTYWVVDEYAGAGNNDCVNHYSTTNFTTCWQTAQTNAVLKFVKTSSGVYQEFGVTPPPPPPATITGNGTVSRLAKFITSTSIGDSLFSDDGVNSTLTSGNLFLQIGSLIDTVASGMLNIGTSVASAINIGRIGITTTLPGTVAIGTLTTTANCISGVSPAACGSAPSGSIAIPNGGSTVVVNTSAVTANSQIFVQEDQSLGTRIGVTCNTSLGKTFVVSSRIPGSSFTIKTSNIPGGSNKVCLSYWVVN
jgi:hypothetical protein